MILTIDTFAWIEMIRGSPLAAQAREAIEAAEHCLTPSIVLAEVASKCVREGFGDPAVRQELDAIRESSEIVRIDARIAIAGAHNAQELRNGARARKISPPGLADGLVLATARCYDARLLTGDPHFEHRPETLWLG